MNYLYKINRYIFLAGFSSAYFSKLWRLTPVRLKQFTSLSIRVTRKSWSSSGRSFRSTGKRSWCSRVPVRPVPSGGRWTNTIGPHRRNRRTSPGNGRPGTRAVRLRRTPETRRLNPRPPVGYYSRKKHIIITI